jgi:phosphoenolpyruvate carboxykinase (GTP)
VEAIKTPTGYVPYYRDLKNLFKQYLNKDYTEIDYVRQFSTRVTENITKIDRVIEIYTTKVPNTPQIVFQTLEDQKLRLVKANNKYGEHIPPYIFLIKGKEEFLEEAKPKPKITMFEEEKPEE